MNETPRSTIPLPALLLILMMGNAARAQPPFYRIGSPYPPLRDPRLTTDNGIPGSGAYYYLHYPWPSLRAALNEYGLFGRRFRSHAAAGAMATPPAPALLRVHLPADAELRVGGQVTSQRGAWRRFVTPPLSPGPPGEYELEASWNEQGRPVRLRRIVRIEPGAEVVIDFLRDAEDSSTLPPPRPLLSR